MDNLTTILDLKQKVKNFVDSRSWNRGPYNNIKNISISIACESSELMKLFKWHNQSDIPVMVQANIKEIRNEVADIAFILLEFCNQLNIDLSDAIDEKMLLHAKKYPAKVEYSRTFNRDASTTLASLKEKARQFCTQRNWYHNAQMLSVDILDEAIELLEIFNWKTDSEINEAINEKLQDIRYEVADIAFALLSFCNELDIDLSSAMEEKILINAQKYPVKKL